MRAMIAGAAAAAATLLMMTPQRRGKISPWTAAEFRAAAGDVLRRPQDIQRAAVVTSLWAARPARQCVVKPRYAMSVDHVDLGVLRFAAVAPRAAAPEGARALLARLQSAGYAASEAEAVAFMLPSTPGRRAA